MYWDIQVVLACWPPPSSSPVMNSTMSFSTKYRNDARDLWQPDIEFWL